MFKIGLLDKYNKNSIDTKQTFDNQCEVYTLSKESIIDQLSMIDGIVMHYKKDIEKSILYEQIVIVRNVSTIPIWVISEAMSTRERLTFLKLGALVIIKEGIFDEELSLSLANALQAINQRRSFNGLVTASRLKNIEISESNSSIQFKTGQTVHLTRLEFQLFMELSKVPNQAVSYDKLSQLIWEESFKKGNQYRLANLVFHVRQKLKKENVNPLIIKTVRSRGYMLAE